MEETGEVYLVQWSHCHSAEDSWEPCEHADPVLPTLLIFQGKPETTKVKRYLLIFKCRQQLKNFFDTV